VGVAAWDAVFQPRQSLGAVSDGCVFGRAVLP
jgi:hypothetical protein